MITTKAKSTLKCDELTVVVAFRNEYHNLSVLLKNIDRLKILPSKFIFVNDHSQDDWSELFEKTNPDLIATYSLNEAAFGKKSAIQEGVKRAATKYILCWDADIQFENNYFKADVKYVIFNIMMISVLLSKIVNHMI